MHKLEDNAVLQRDWQTYAKLMLNLYYGNVQDAQNELFTAAAAYHRHNIEGTFWRKVWDEISRLGKEG